MNLKNLKPHKVSDSNEVEQFIANLTVMGKAKCPITKHLYTLKRDDSSFTLFEDGKDVYSFTSKNAPSTISQLKKFFKVKDSSKPVYRSSKKVSDAEVSEDYVDLIGEFETFHGTFIEATEPGIFASIGNGAGDIEFIPNDDENFGEYEDASMTQEVIKPGYYAVCDNSGEILSVELTGNLLEDLVAMNTIEWDWETYPTPAEIAESLQTLLESDTSVEIEGLEITSETEGNEKEISSEEGELLIPSKPTNSDLMDCVSGIATWVG